MRRAVELPDIHDVALILQYRSLIVVDVQIVRCGEDRHDRREPCCLRFPIHSIAMHSTYQVKEL